MASEGHYRERILQVFKQLDKDNSGTITKQELLAAFTTLSVSTSPQEIEEIISSADKSGDGALDFDEFCKFYENKLRIVFSELDNDNSGDISVFELQSAFEKLGYKATPREIKILISQVDTNHDGVVNFSEFCDYFSSLPSPNMKMIVEKWASGISVDVGSDLAPPPLPPPSVSILRALSAGGVAGVVSRTATAPLEKIKILSQTSTSERYLRIIPSMKEVIVKEKWIGLFSGNGANCLRVLPFSGLVCLAYSNLAKYFPLDAAGNNNSLSAGFGRMMAGTFAGSFATLCTHPIDVIRAKLTVQANNQGKIINTFGTVFQNQGIKGLYKGLGPTLIAIGPFIGVQQSTYDLLKHWFTNKGFETSPFLFLTCGSLAGITAQTVIYPLDVIRRRMQVHSHYKNSFAVAKDLIVKRKLFAGLSVTYVKVMPSVAISLLVRDALLGRLS